MGTIQHMKLKIQVQQIDVGLDVSMVGCHCSLSEDAATRRNDKNICSLWFIASQTAALYGGGSQTGSNGNQQTSACLRITQQGTLFIG